MLEYPIDRNQIRNLPQTSPLSVWDIHSIAMVRSRSGGDVAAATATAIHYESAVITRHRTRARALIRIPTPIHYAENPITFLCLIWYFRFGE